MLVSYLPVFGKLAWPVKKYIYFLIFIIIFNIFCVKSPGFTRDIREKMQENENI